MTDLPLSERGRLLSDLAATLATLPINRPQTWRLGEALRQLLRADGAAITVEYLSSSRTTLCASDDVAAGLESLQEITGEGPGFQAARENVLVATELGADPDERWPMLTHAVTERFGVIHVNAVPLRALNGVATVYSRATGALVDSPAPVTFLATAIGSALVADAVGAPEGQALLGEDWSSRSVIHQATGMVMAQLRVTADDALVLLRGHAYAMETDIAEVADRVVSRQINFSSFDVEGD